ncbi:MAG TPA: TIGR03790 family protein [Tepidisphaeraceae bacterium]
MKRRVLLCSIAIVLAVVSRAWALAPDELLLLTNSTNPAGERLAQFYAKARLVPDGRILSLKLPNNDEISWDNYERDVVPEIRKYIRQHKLQEKVRCIVTFYGVPLRISGKKPTASEQQELATVRGQFDKTLQDTAAAVEEAEAFARQIDPSFQSAGAGPLETYGPRATAALGTIDRALRSAVGGISQKNAQRMIQILDKLSGNAEVLRQFKDDELAKIFPAEAAQQWMSRRGEVESEKLEIQRLEESRYEADARQRLREIAPKDFGLFGTLNLLRSLQDYLMNDGTASAFDNELATLWWNFYPRSSSLPNLLNYKYRDRPVLPVMMVMRLDAPQEALVNNIILSSLRAEKDGLQGRFAIDATGGLGLDGKIDRKGGYASFDNTLTHLATMVRASTKMPLTLDTKVGLFPPNSVKDMSVYTGWYSVRNFIPPGTFKPGAVAVHIASYECVTLHLEGEKGWCANLLNEGVAVTMGAVAEPYLDAFPVPDEFFPLLLTGKISLAETYWSTLPQVSWMMTCIGDPLYTPFKANPQMRVEDLPEGVRSMFVRRATTVRDPLGPEPGQEKPHGQGVLHQ